MVFRASFHDDWAEMQNPNSEAVDEWDARTRLIQDPEELQEEMDSLGDQYSQLTASSITERYAFIPAHPKPITYITSTFLHVDWWHVIGNMWFLWLAGFVLEDAWGRPLYLLVYLAAGAFACQFDAWANPGSIVRSVGASGAIAGLMGAFLVRFPKMKIRMMWFFDLGPVSLFSLLDAGILAIADLGADGNQLRNGAKGRDWTLGARRWFPLWRHCGRGDPLLGVGTQSEQGNRGKVAWTPDPEISQAGDLMEHRKFDEAAATLNNYLTTKPDSVEAWNLLRAVYWRASNISAYREATGKLCDLHVRSREYETAWQDYEDFLNAGGERIPPDVWLDLCRVPEQQQDFERAVSEYEKLAAAYPSERQSLLAQLGAARICLKRLNRPLDALRLYEGASASAVPHLDLEQDIAIGNSGSQNRCSRRLRHSPPGRRTLSKSKMESAPKVMRIAETAKVFVLEDSAHMLIIHPLLPITCGYFRAVANLASFVF